MNNGNSLIDLGAFFLFRGWQKQILVWLWCNLGEGFDFIEKRTRLFWIVGPWNGIMAGIEVELIAVDNGGMRTQKVFLFFFLKPSDQPRKKVWVWENLTFPSRTQKDQKGDFLLFPYFMLRYRTTFFQKKTWAFQLLQESRQSHSAMGAL